ncbi:MAG: aminotransferase class IV [Anaerolineae bacterium]|nr:aminotransferase class IV [Anaerolineae bacterium]
MPCFIRTLTPDGRLHPVDYTANSLAEAVPYEPEGIYTVTNTYHTFQVLKLDAHLDRMEDSARREDIPLALDRARLRAGLRQVIEQAGFGDVRFRVTIPRTEPDHWVLSVEPFMPPSPALIENGVRCITVPGLARRNPAAKTNDWAQNRSQFSLPAGMYEGLLVNETGEILEGFTSNFYAILNGELRTAGAGVFDAATMIRVIHHMADVPTVLAQVRRVLTPGGMFILEHANKQNIKAMLRYALKQQTWSPYQLDPVEFVELNFDFHPEYLQSELRRAGFEIKQRIPVSFFRVRALKERFPVDVLVSADSVLQHSGLLVTPSIFVQSTAATLKTPNNLHSEIILACPETGAPLTREGDTVVCKTTGQRWAIRDGIYDFKAPLD